MATLTLEQQKAVAIATAKAKARQRAESGPSIEAVDEPQQPNTAIDMLRSVPGGLAKGGAALAGLPGDLQRLVARGVANIFGRSGDEGERMASVMPGAVPTSQTIGETVSAPFGGFYTPQTTAGEYTETAASFAPAAIAPGGAFMRGMRVLVPSVASETAGQLTEGTPLEPYARAGAALVGGGVTEGVRALARPTMRVANKAVETIRGPARVDPVTGRVKGGGFLNPETEAVRRLQSAINREGGPQAVTRALNQWAQTDASNPALIDVTGGNVRRLVRAAASGSEGNAQNVAQQYMNRVGAGLQDEASRLTRGLPPTNTPINAGQYADDLAEMQQHLARNEYRVPYSQPASVTPEMVSALQGSEGRAAIGRAMRGASANRDHQQIGELRELLAAASNQGTAVRNPVTGQFMSLEQQLQSLSSGALDRVRIAMREMGGAHARAGHGDIARGLRNRVTDIDTALDQTPGLREARQSYRQTQAQRDAVELGRQGLNQPSSAYGPELARLQGISPESQIGAGVGYRQGLLDAIEKSPQGVVGPVNRIGSAPQQTENLAATFGQPVAQRYQSGMRNELQRLVNARSISPNTGSQTALRAEEMAVLDTLPFGQKAGMVARAIDMLKRGLSLTEAEKEAIVRLGTTEADIRRVLTNVPPRTAPLAVAQRLLIAGQVSQGNVRAR